MIVRVGGEGSEFPVASIAVRETTYEPGVENVTAPGFCATEVVGLPPGKTQEYWATVLVVPKITVPPAEMVTFVEGVVMLPDGGVEPWVDNWMNCAFEGTPALSIKNSM